MSFFGVGTNPFATPIGAKIEKATCPTLVSEDWGLNMEICDHVNQSEEGPRDAIKALRKRVTAQPKNYTSIMYTLTVLETCVKNCDKRFHTLACSKDFVQELVKLIGPKNEPPPAVQEKVLAIIQSWAETFCHNPDLSGVCQIYADLKHKGIEFPTSDSEQNVPIITPHRTSEAIPALVSASPIRRPPATQYTGEPPPGIGVCPATLTSEQKAKLHSELDLVEGNSKVLAEMLNELSPGKEEPEDLQLLQDLHATCRAMQERVVELVGRVNDDLLTADLLRINDDLNNLFVRYDRHMSKNKTVTNHSVASPARTVPVTVSELPAKREDEAPLIDLGEDTTVDLLANINIGKKNEDVDFDMFAQSRTSTTDGKSSEPQSVDILDQDQRASDFDEMEQWLKANPVAAAAQNSSRVPEETLSSSEFDKFLAERAAVAENLPTVAGADSVPMISAATGSSSIQQLRSRTLTKDDQNEKKLFSL